MIEASVPMSIVASGVGPGLDVLLVVIPVFVAWVLAILGGLVWWLVGGPLPGAGGRPGA